MSFAPMNPMLLCEDLDETIAFYRDVLGFEVAGTWPADEPTWCSLSYGPGSLMFVTEHPGPGEHDAPLLTGLLYFYPGDVDDYFARVRDGTPRVLHEPCDQEYGMREFRIVDPNGYVLAFGRALDG